MKRKFAILLSAMLLMQAVCGCGGAASSGTSSASASTGSTASKSSRPVHINRNVPKEKTPRKALSKMSKAQIRRFRAPALLFSYYFLKSLSSVLPSLLFHSAQPFALAPRTNIAAELGDENDIDLFSTYSLFTSVTSPFFRADRL